MMTARFASILLLCAGIVACRAPTDSSSAIDVRYAKAASGVSVTSATPSSGPQDITLDVQISGSGFVSGSTASWLLNGAPDPRVRTNSTRYVNPTSLVANITISIDAVPAKYDIEVATPLGKKGIGTEAFTVLPMIALPTVGDGNASDVTTSGDIVGSRSGGCNSGSLPVIWHAGGNAIDLPLLGGSCSGFAQYINEAGIIMGHMNPGGTAIPVRWIPDGTGYRVEDMGQLPSGGPPDIRDMNGSGHAIVNRNGGTANRPYWWSAETGYVALPNAIGGDNCFTGALNDRDEVIGSCGVGGISYPAYWSSPTSLPVMLPRAPGYDGLHAGTALNGNGGAVGYAMKHLKNGQLVTNAVRWTQSGTTWIVELLSGLGGPESSANDINDLGWATGSANVSTGKNHAVLWIPGQPARDLGAIGPESWGNAITPSSALATLIVGGGDVANGRKAILWRP